MKRLPPFARSIFVIAWAIFLIAPIAFLLNRSVDTSASLDWFSGIYEGFVGLFGENAGRWLFCGSWLALNALVFWAVMLRRGREDPGVSLDLDD